jgi:endogenous inhibitor of DNA gyrase (YacG/DUF329 family)
VRFTCPTCRRVVESATATADARPYRPFCSERCRSADLGNWLNASYRISAPIAEEDLDQGLSAEGESSSSRGEDPN